jgi:hypothetical protein
MLENSMAEGEKEFMEFLVESLQVDIIAVCRWKWNAKYSSA